MENTEDWEARIAEAKAKDADRLAKQIFDSTLDDTLDRKLSRADIRFEKDMELKPLNSVQKQKIGILAYMVHVSGTFPTPEEIQKIWKGAGKPSTEQIAEYFSTEEWMEDADRRGLPVIPDDLGLTERQVGLLQVLSDTSLAVGLNERLRRSGVSMSEFRAWKRQPKFYKTFRTLVGQEVADSPEQLDVQLLSLANNGSLKAIQYANDLLGRGPQNKQNVDAARLVQIVLEAVTRHCTPDQLKAIQAEIELAGRLAIAAPGVIKQQE